MRNVLFYDETNNDILQEWSILLKQSPVTVSAGDRSPFQV
jgi:hypothetical protein